MAHTGRGRALRPDGVVDRPVAVDRGHAADEDGGSNHCGVGIGGNRVRFDVRARRAVTEAACVQNASDSRIVGAPVGGDRLEYRLPAMARVAIIAGEGSPDYVSRAVELRHVVRGVTDADLVALRDDEVPVVQDDWGCVVDEDLPGRRVQIELILPSYLIGGLYLDRRQERRVGGILSPLRPLGVRVRCPPDERRSKRHRKQKRTALHFLHLQIYLRKYRGSAPGGRSIAPDCFRMRRIQEVIYYSALCAITGSTSAAAPEATRPSNKEAESTGHRRDCAINEPKSKRLYGHIGWHLHLRCGRRGDTPRGQRRFRPRAGHRG